MKRSLDVRFPEQGVRPAAWISVGIVLNAIVWLFSKNDQTQAAFSMLTSTYFWMTIVLGAIFFTMLHHIVSAKWSVVVRRISENMGRIVLPMGLMMIIVAWIAMPELYPWSDVNAVRMDHVLAKKAGYLNAKFFTFRSIFYVLVWTGISSLLWKYSTRDDTQFDTDNYASMRKVSAIGLLLFGLTFTFSSFDWIMSLDPHWYSTIFGLYCFAGAVVAMVSTLILVCLFLEKKGYLKGIVTTEHFHDMGKLLFAFICFWAYMAFSQYLLIWYANIPEETIFYFHRWTGSWKPLSLILAIGHFAVPFVLSMPKPMKRNRKWLAFWAVWMLVLHYIDIYWLVVPNYHHHGVHFSWTDVFSFAAGGCVFIGSLIWLLPKSNLVAKNDPKIEASLHFRNS